MTSQLAGATFRAHRPAFAGTAVAAFFAATVVSTATTLLVTTDGDGLSASARRTLAEHSVGSTAAVLLIGSIYMSIFVVASTMSTAVVQEQREFALARTVGARPRQIRRTVVRQAVVTALPAAVAGCAAGAVVGRWWFDAMVAHGLVPQEVRFSFSWPALPVCLAVAGVTSCLAAFLASLRFSLLRPAGALEEAASGRRGLGWPRTLLGLIATAGAASLAVLLSGQPADEAGEGAFLVLILFCVGAGLLGPRLMGPAAWVVSALVGRFGSSARLAMLNIRSQPRRFSAAVVPLVLVVGFGLTKIGMHTTAQHHIGSAGSRGELWMDYAGTSLYAGFAAIAAANTLAMISFERSRDIALLRVVGTLPGQIRAMAAWESVVVAGTALLVGGAISVVTMAPILGTAFGSPVPHIPWPLLAALGTCTLLLAGLATGLPVHRVLRRRAIRVVQAS